MSCMENEFIKNFIIFKEIIMPWRIEYIYNKYFFFRNLFC